MMNNFLRSLAFTGLTLLSLISSPLKPTNAQNIETESRSTIVVTTFSDDYLADGLCSLREAIIAANTDSATMGCPAGSVDDTIQLASGTYAITRAGAFEDSGLTGDLDITNTLTIIGLGQDVTIIDGGDLDRVFDVHENEWGAITAEFVDLKITNGTAPTGASDGEDGGGIRCETNVTLDNVLLSYNYAGNGINETGNGGDGGGIYCEADLVLWDTTIKSNRAGNGADLSGLGTSGDGGSGGGIYSNGSLWIEDSQVTTNYAGNSGHGILGQQSYAGSAGHGGGIMGLGTSVVVTSRVDHNRAGNAGDGPGGEAGKGGGIYNDSSLNVMTSEIDYNRPGNGKDNLIAGGYGGGLYNASGDTAIIIGSSIFRNYGHVDGIQPRGAGIYNAGTVGLGNSTVAENEEPYLGGGVYNASSGTLILNNSTIAWNQSQKGGGIYNSGGSVTLGNSLLAWNVGWQGGYDCEGDVVSVGYNLIRDLTSKMGGAHDVCFVTGDLTGVMTGDSYNPLLSSFGYYGGATKNYVPLIGSPLINAGNPLAVDPVGYACGTDDQRGVSRPQDGICDIGATEATEQFTLSKTVDVVYTYPGQIITFSILVSNIGALDGSDITITDELPPGLEFAGPVTLSTAHPETTLAQDASDLPDLVTGLQLLAGQSLTVYFPVRTSFGFPPDQVITNTASIFSAIPQSGASGIRNVVSGWLLHLPLVLR